MNMFKAALVACLIAIPVRAAAEYPERPVKLIVPFAAGGVADLMGRLVGQKITATTGKPIIVENRTGAGGRIGYEAGVRSNPDGYTFVVTDVTYTMFPSLYETMPWGPDDLAPVTFLGETPFVIAMTSKAEPNSLPEMVAFAKARPARLNYGSAGHGTINHMVTELFARTSGVEMTHVPYRGMGDAMNGLLGGSLDVMITALPTAMSAAKGGLIKALAVTSSRRAAALPDTPTATEAGQPLVSSNWIGLTAPKGTPAEAIRWLQKHSAEAISSPEIADRFAEQGVQAVSMTTAEFAAFMDSEGRRWAEVIRASNLKKQ